MLHNNGGKTMGELTGSIDRIEQQIDIEATAQRVWELISTPGWWINDGAIIEHRVDQRESHVVVHDPVHGEFVLRIEALESPRYAAYRWFSDASAAAYGDPALDGSSTLVEFWIEERDGGGVTLRVAESGFEGLDRTAEERRKMFDENTEGWTIELAAARVHLTGA
jgi:uncharacterized protein YndB with AHSA1/START domain